MDLNAKLIIDEIAKRFAENNVKWEQRLAEFDGRQGERVERLEEAVASFKERQPQIEATVEDARLEIRKMSRFYNRSVSEFSSTELGIIPNLNSKNLSASERPSASDPYVDGSARHCDEPPPGRQRPRDLF